MKGGISFQVIVLDGPLGKVNYHAIRVEFKVRGSPHIRSFLWILHAPRLSKDNIDKYIFFVDGIITALLPDRDIEPEIFELETSYQLQSHSKYCRKYKNDKCRYNFG